uniref:NDRG family protein n=1 Tax=Escherichia coli TaxID=562 RepID=UPI00200DEECB
MFRPTLFRGLSADAPDVSDYGLRSRRASLSAEQKRRLSMLRTSSIPTALTPKYVVSTDRSGDIHVHVQGDLSQQDKRCVFLTVHDLGTNHSSLVDFVNSPAMAEIKER